MESAEAKSKKNWHVLSSSDRASEILFGLIMVLSFTSSMSASSAGQQGNRTMLIGALGCNLAWGIVDAVMYLMTNLGERGRSLLLLRRVHGATAEDAHHFIAESMPATVAGVILPAELESIRQKLLRIPEPSARPGLKWEDFVGALCVFLLVFVSILPVMVPFIVIRNAMLALRISNAIAIVMLFGVGCSVGRDDGYRSWHVGLGVVAIGLVLVGITIALGG